MVGEYDLRLAAAAADEFEIIGHIVHAGEGMHRIPEDCPVLLLAENIAPGVDSLLVQQILVEEVVADFVGGVAEHEVYLLHRLRDAAETDGEAVAGEDREYDADGVASYLCGHVLGYGVYRGVVAHGTGHDGFRHSDDVPVVQGEAFTFGSVKDAFRDDGGEIVAFSDDGRADAS